MDVLGILCLGFMAIYFINGCRKGFFVNLIESIKAIGVIILAIVFCETAGNYVLESSVGASIIETLEGDMTANVGDFIIKGVQGEFYPCKPDIFEQTYDESPEAI